MNFNKVALTIIPIFIAVFLLIYLITSSNWFIKKKYTEFKKLEIKSIILKKIDEHPVKNNEIYIKNSQSIHINREIFDIINVGDSIIKAINSDSIMLKTRKGIYFIDQNKFLREKLYK